MPPRRVQPKPAARTAAAAHHQGADGPPAKGTNRYLPPHEADLFRQVLTLYESKENRKGLKVVDEILAKYPDHGESLCMRGIFLHSLGRKTEGYELVERGTKNDLESHIVWHVYALMRRADKQFDEALACYKKACAIEENSLNLLSDLSTLTIHLRHYDDYVGVRLSILKSQPRMRRNWLALAVAQFLARQYAAASKTLTAYEDMLREVPEGDVEMGECLLFHAQVLEEAGELEKCLEFLGEKSGQITNKTEYGVQRARLLLALNRTEPAIWAWETLLEENPESREYIRAMVQAKGASCDAQTPEDRAKAVKVLDELADKYPRSLSIRRLALDLAPASSAEFRTKTSAYLLTALRKGIPSLFADVKALYKLPDGEGAEKARVVGEIVQKFREELEEKGAVVTDEQGDDDSLDSPSTYLWTLYFLASHHSHPLNPASSQTLALETLAIAEQHTPSLPELSMLRARIHKRAGDPVAAAAAMEHARSLDGQDRFLNSKAAKYAIRAGDCEGAEKTVGLFTKKDAPSPLEDLVEMQCLWFLQEEGDAYAQKEDYGRALRRYHQIYDIFQEVEEDQYDFHSYCMRKSTFKAYIEMLRFEDKLRDHPRFAAAAEGAIAIYLRMFDEPEAFPEQAAAPLANGEAEDKKEETKEEAKKEEQKEAAPAAKSKKDKKKGKKAAAAPPPAAAAAAAPEEPEEEEPAPPLYYVDSDPTGSSHLATGRSAPLAEARKFLTHLERIRPTDVRTQVLAAQVAIREGKLLLALKAIRSARALMPDEPALVSLGARFKLALEKAQERNEAVKTVLDEGVVELFGAQDASLAAWVDEQLQRFGAGENGAEYLLQAAKAKKLAGAQDGEVAALLEQLAKREDLRTSVEQSTAALALFRSLPSSADAVPSFLTAAASRFPLARAFKTEQELAKLDAELQAQKESEKEEVVE
ncbi:hypothetical protein JCM10213v2_007558 [Rhodosporidiobolus nylandii]